MLMSRRGQHSVADMHVAGAGSEGLIAHGQMLRHAAYRTQDPQEVPLGAGSSARLLGAEEAGLLNAHIKGLLP